MMNMMNYDKFGLINEINVEDRLSWERVFLTFDIDWAHDEILEDTMNLVLAHKAKATWFITHETKHLEALRSNKAWEIGIHPNFNALLDGTNQSGSSALIIDELLGIQPEPQSIRSHSLVQSSRLLNMFKNIGIKYDSNDYIPSNSGIELKPFKLENDLIKVPYFFSDELWCLNDMGKSNFLKLPFKPGLKVFDFHPIHIFLNTENLNRYEATRNLHKKPSELIKHRFLGYGTRNRLLDILSLSKSYTI